jgi:hypothetical protein
MKEHDLYRSLTAIRAVKYWEYCELQGMQLGQRRQQIGKLSESRLVGRPKRSWDKCNDIDHR